MPNEDMEILSIKVLRSSQKGDQMDQESSRQEEQDSESRNQHTNIGLKEGSLVLVFLQQVKVV